MPPFAACPASDEFGPRARSDGYIAGPDEGPGKGLGEGSERPHYARQSPFATFVDSRVKRWLAGWVRFALRERASVEERSSPMLARVVTFQGGSADLDAMDPPEGMGSRSSVDVYEVGAEVRM
jgi:hypothetical protein